MSKIRSVHRYHLDFPCLFCGLSTIYDRRVYFGVFGPFCDVDCREAYLASEREAK